VSGRAQLDSRGFKEGEQRSSFFFRRDVLVRAASRYVIFVLLMKSNFISTRPTNTVTEATASAGSMVSSATNLP
jgi:hypothetical protein